MTIDASTQQQARSVATFTHEVVVDSLAFAVAGIACKFFGLIYAFPLFAIAGSMALTKAVVLAVESYKPLFFSSVKTKILEFHQKYPLGKPCLFLSSLALCHITVIAGIVVGIAVGVLSGVVIKGEQVHLQHPIKQEQQNNPSALSGTITA